MLLVCLGFYGSLTKERERRVDFEVQAVALMHRQIWETVDAMILVDVCGCQVKGSRGRAWKNAQGSD